MTRLPPELQCGAKKHQGEGHCTQRAGWGTDHPGYGRCKLHGGQTGSHRRKADMEIAREECKRLGIPIETTGAEALIHAVWEAAGNVEFYRRLVAQLEADPKNELVLDEEGVLVERRAGALYGETYHATGRATGEAKAHILVQLYNEERDRLANYSAAAVKCNVDQALVRLAATDAQALFGAVADALDATGLTLEQAERFRYELGTILQSRFGLPGSGGPAAPTAEPDRAVLG